MYVSSRYTRQTCKDPDKLKKVEEEAQVMSPDEQKANKSQTFVVSIRERHPKGIVY